MIVQSVTNTTGTAPLILREALSQMSGYDEWTVALGKSYVVYGIAVKRGIPGFLILSRTPEYPKWYPYCFFDIVDGRLSKYWQFEAVENESELVTLLTFPEWASDDHYYDSLTDGEVEAVNCWHRYRTLIRLEAFDLLDMQNVLSRLAEEQSITLEEAESLRVSITSLLDKAEDNDLRQVFEGFSLLWAQLPLPISSGARDLFEAHLHEHREKLADLSRQVLG